MRENSLCNVIRSGNTAVNAWISTDSSYSAEVLANTGFDSVTIDAQHGMFGPDTVVKLLQAVSASPATPMVRPTSVNLAEIGWLLDAGAYGIIAPSVDSPELARELVDACFYPPLGRRSFGPSRGLLYGGSDYATEANHAIVPWAMIESGDAVEQMDAIMSTPGLYGVYLGPNDLALDLGLKAGGDIAGPVADIAHRIVERAHRHGLAAGLFCSGAEEATKWADAGFDLVTPGNDVSMLRSAATQRIAAIRDPAKTLTATTGGY
ncbi:HpcH/HpaI aldolase/citrate lyase family protein [Arthrobacter sp. 18067]|uniref:HpcH/HpaI aldolase family protein n=1 Tax=Arthrobacter sp. 18067 TaxID=2681413 RepID=UPI00135A086C|nr:aldolase/citrate lyase family protein [Arthrobacter sp. 18067]